MMDKHWIRNHDRCVGPDAVWQAMANDWSGLPLLAAWLKVDEGRHDRRPPADASNRAGNSESVLFTVVNEMRLPRFNRPERAGQVEATPASEPRAVHPA
jgi:hypothetical protein